MKNKISYILCLFALLIGGCSRFARRGKSSQTSSSGGSSSSISGESIEPGRLLDVDIYSSNDIHGQIMEENGRAGLLSYANFFNEKGKIPNTLLIDQGDTWQGSIYSNYNHGQFLTEVMNYIQFDARSVGNHDFDWGVDYLIANTAKSYAGYSTPVLAGNVYEYNFATRQISDNQRSDIGGKSTIKTLENGLRVGILGGIGKDQITSISSNYTQDIAFVDHIQFIKEEATYLRNVEHCDIVIASIHTGQENLLYNGLQNYVDLVLCGHTHYQETTNEGNLYYVQAKAYAQSFGHTRLRYDTTLRRVISTKVEFLTANYVINSVTSYDPGIEYLFNEYVSDCSESAEEIVASNVTSYFQKNGSAENLMAKAIYDQAKEEGYDVCVSYVNVARNGLPIYSWKYADLYQSFPFDNEIYIATVTGREFMNEIGNYNFIYRNPNFTTDYIDLNGTYTIAVIDYLYFHTDTNRFYDYFPETGGQSTTKLSKNYRVILKDWLKKNNYNQGEALDPSYYSSSLWQHDNTLFQVY